MVGGTGCVVFCCVIVSVSLPRCAVPFFRSGWSRARSRCTDEAVDWLISGESYSYFGTEKELQLHGRMGSGSHGCVEVPGVPLALAGRPCLAKQALTVASGGPAVASMAYSGRPISLLLLAEWSAYLLLLSSDSLPESFLPNSLEFGVFFGTFFNYKSQQL